MPQSREYLESLGLEIAKKKYYNAAKVESVIDDLVRRASELEGENASLRERAEALASGREEIGEAILSARTIARQLIDEAKETAETMLASAREEADRTVAAAREEADVLLADAKARAEALRDGDRTREQATVRGVQTAYLTLREQCLDAVKLLDGEWQRFLCSLGDDAPASGELPDDLPEKLGALADCLSDIGKDDEAEQ